MKQIKKIIFGWLFCFLLLLPEQAMAGTIDEEEIKDLSTAEKLEQVVPNVVEIEFFYYDEEDEVHVLHTGSGFFIGQTEDAPQYVLTSNKVVTLWEEERELLQSNEAEDSSAGVRIVVRQDVTIQASIVTSSDELGFTLLTIEQPLYDRNPMILNDTLNTFEDETEIYSIGIPIQAEKEGTAQISRGNLMREEEVEGVHKWIHNSYRNAGYIGGPLVDEEGTVLGINQSDVREEFLYATEIREVLPVLDALGISYRTTEMERKKKQEEEQQWKDALDSVTALTGPIGSLPSGSNSKRRLLFIIVGAVLFIAGIVILIVLLLTKDKRAEKKKKRKEEFTVTQAAPVFEDPIGEQRSALLLRAKTGQKEAIVGERFLIGKERGRTDFYIGDNTAVSRMHACILKKAEGYFLTEQHATNGTFLNEERLHPGEEKLLKNGDKIRLADEAFEFITSL